MKYKEWQERAEAVRNACRQMGVDGWLLYDFRHSNAEGLSTFGISADVHLTRRFFYWVPVVGETVKIVSALEVERFADLPGVLRSYSTYQELHNHLVNTLQGAAKVAMDYSPQCALPVASTVDAGTVEQVRALGVEVVSAIELLTIARPGLRAEALDSHRRAAEICAEVADRTWDWIAAHLFAKTSITEFDVQEFVMGEFAAWGAVTDHRPIVAVNAHSANPHYLPNAHSASVVQPGDWILLDLWCRLDQPSSIYGDLTFVAVAGDKPSQMQQKVFDAAKAGRTAALTLIKERFKAKRPLKGFEVDAACRKVIKEAGYGEAFIHRTGHNIATVLHGPGTNMDDFETHDTRPVMPATVFSVEPGIYLPGAMGIRLECDVLITAEGDVEVTGRPQEAIVCLLK